MRRWLTMFVTIAFAVCLFGSGTALGQEVRSDKTYDELLVEVAEMVPEFAGLLGGGSLKILVTEPRPGILDEARAALDKVFGSDQWEHYPSTELVEVKYSWIELWGWYEPMRAVVWSYDGVSMSGISEKDNRLHFGVLDPNTQAQAIYDEAKRQGVPDDAITVVEMGYIQTLGGGEADLPQGKTESDEATDSGGTMWWLPALIVGFGLLMVGAALERRRARRSAVSA